MTDDAETINIVLVDDHALFLEGLKELVSRFMDCKVLYTADSGSILMNKLQNGNTLPDIILLDMKMKEMDGIGVLKNIKQEFPAIHVLMLTMMNNENFMITAIKNGAAGYLLKDSSPDLLHEGIKRTFERGFFYTPEVNELLIDTLNRRNGAMINDRERQFLQLTCSELTYKEIASKMFVSARTVDGYRESLFNKLAVKSRTGLVLYAVKSGLVKIEEL